MYFPLKWDLFTTSCDNILLLEILSGTWLKIDLLIQVALYVAYSLTRDLLE